MLRIMFNDELYTTTAKIANPIEENDGVGYGVYVDHGNKLRGKVKFKVNN